MSADFGTQLTVKGTREEYKKVLKLLRYFAEDSKEREQDNILWYFDKKTSCFEDDKLNEFIRKGVMFVSLCGPYGEWNGLVGDEIDLFKRIADAIPDGVFQGNISGFDPGWDHISVEAELRDGLLYQRAEYKEFVDYDDEKEEDTAKGKAEEKWDDVYNPKTKEWTHYK